MKLCFYCGDFPRLERPSGTAPGCWGCEYSKDRYRAEQHPGREKNNKESVRAARLRRAAIVKWSAIQDAKEEKSVRMTASYKRSRTRRNRFFGQSSVNKMPCAISGPDCAGADYENRPEHLEVDHIVARHVGGPDVDDNLQIACLLCHATKTRQEREARPAAKLKA